MEDVRVSYASANVFPAKILSHQELIRSCREEKHIPPVHVQLNLTNRCNFSCDFCSCSARDKKLELSYKEIMDVMSMAENMGCESVTITGGGEPLMHPEINEIIEGIADLGIVMGLVPNGTLLRRLETDVLNRITWIRVSCSDAIRFESTKMGKDFDWWIGEVQKAVNRGKDVDWAFSYVISKNLDYNAIERIVTLANENNFTHVRLVCDIFKAQFIAHKLSDIADHLRRNDIDDSRVNYQARAMWTDGTSECYISLLKPMIGADGYWYPCCGTQYALEEPTRDYEKAMRMSDKRLTEGLDEIVRNQKYFDGSICAKCYYENYNWALETLLSEIRHLEFV